jgi:hypothetical protein
MNFFDAFESISLYSLLLQYYFLNAPANIFSSGQISFNPRSRMGSDSETDKRPYKTRLQEQYANQNYTTVMVSG